MEQALSSEVFAALTAVDTPTVCNAIELVLGRRTAEGFTIRPVLAAHPNLPAIVGYARTGLILSSLPSEDSPDAVRARRIAYYRYVAAHPGPAVVVLQDIDPRPGLGAFWGEVNVAIHKGLGARGVLTNGSMRDLGAVDPGFQILAGSLSPSHAFVRIEEFECPVEVFGLRVKPNDLVHADRHGAVIIDPELARELPRIPKSSLPQNVNLSGSHEWLILHEENGGLVQNGAARFHGCRNERPQDLVPCDALEQIPNLGRLTQLADCKASLNYCLAETHDFVTGC